MPAESQTPDWLTRQFEFEYCDECHGDAEHHEVIPVLGNPFARCLYPRSEDDACTLHPTIAKFHQDAERVIE